MCGNWRCISVSISESHEGQKMRRKTVIGSWSIAVRFNLLGGKCG